ncbi:hypothetical protein M378DRAFT_873935 [Amanita muscaria Koide BX008]|uniref:Uncharacterized protein n=1 Tax=Amanita muscaria (strain Koide BX008) TaxID=946122 RepID=A0A0C2T3B0_AMAMK|nr:hypothetical protein M378DRAFT_873935 [Amanita muscaria Koide BX008]
MPRPLCPVLTRVQRSSTGSLLLFFTLDIELLESCHDSSLSDVSGVPPILQSSSHLRWTMERDNEATSMRLHIRRAPLNCCSLERKMA